MKHTTDLIEHMLAECEENESRLTNWERGFIDSIQRIEPYQLTAKQEQKLKDIYERVTE